MKICQWITAVLMMGTMFLMMGSNLGYYNEAVSPAEFRTAAAESYESPRDGENSPDQDREYRYQKALSFFVAGYHADAVAILLDLADDVNDQFDLGICYTNGYGVEQDLGQAVEWFEKAASQDCADALFILGKYYYEGSALEQDYAKAFEMFERAAELGNAQAQCELGWMYLEGRSPESGDSQPELTDMSAEEFNSIDWAAWNQNDAKAFEWFERAAEQGYAEAQYITGALYSGTGRGVKGDNAKALEWYEKAAQQGYIPAQYSLGSRLKRSDFDQAIQWYERAAEQDNAFAQLDLGLIYLEGDGTDPDYVKAALWLIRAASHEPDDYITRYLLATFDRETLIERGQDYIGLAEQGAADALFNLTNHTELFEAYLLAAENGDAEAQYNVGVCYSNGYGVEQDASKAVEWYKKSAEQGYVYAQYNLGICYFSGKGLEKDYDKAFEMMEKAADQGLANAQVVVAQCYLYGLGVNQNSAKADEWIEKAVEQGIDIYDIMRMYQ